MLMMPAHSSRYGIKNSMPAFRDLEGPTAAVTRVELRDAREARLKEIEPNDSRAEAKKSQIDAASRVLHLSDIDRELIVRWLLNDYRPVLGGDPIVTTDR